MKCTREMGANQHCEPEWETEARWPISVYRGRARPRHKTINSERSRNCDGPIIELIVLPPLQAHLELLLSLCFTASPLVPTEVGGEMLISNATNTSSKTLENITGKNYRCGSRSARCARGGDSDWSSRCCPWKKGCYCVRRCGNTSRRN